MKNKTFIIFSAFTVALITGCNNNSNSGEVKIIKETTVNTSLDTEVETTNSFEFEKEAKDVITNNDYTRYDLGCMSIELPWIDRRYPKATPHKYLLQHQVNKKHPAKS